MKCRVSEFSLSPLLEGLLILLLVSMLEDGVAQDSRKEVIGYYPSWKWRIRDTLASPARLAYDKLTIINYAFFVPRGNGMLAGKDSAGDRLNLERGGDGSLVNHAHRHGVKVLLSIGGWSDSDNFPAIAASPRLRAAFAQSCNAAIVRYGFDGIDIDWEYPGYADHKGSPADRRNFTLLLTLLRDSLGALEARSGRNYLLTAALPAGEEHLRNIEVREVAAILDQINIMTYDYYGPWDSLANHNSPLYSSAGADPSRCIDSSYRLYHETYGIPGSKINLGVPFYGKAYAGCVALNTEHSGADTVDFPSSGPFYYDLVPVLDEFTRYWDSRARVPYLVDLRRRVLVVYDDPESVRAKAEYIVEHNVHGAIIWEITGDILPDGSAPLLDALVRACDSPSQTTR